MPCLTYESPAELAEERARAKEKEPLIQEIETLKREKANLEASLCGVLVASQESDSNWASYFNEIETGITVDQIRSWFYAHQKKDKERKEAEQRRKEELKKAVLAKLTKEEREVLGYE